MYDLAVDMRTLTQLARFPQIAVGSLPGHDDVFPYTPVAFQDGAPHSAQVLLPTQQEGAVVYATVRATNAAGLRSQEYTTGALRFVCSPVVDAACISDGKFVCIA